MQQNIKQLGYVNSALIAVNVLLFLAVAAEERLLGRSFLFSLGVLYAPAVAEGGQYYRMVTSCFLHFDIKHLLNNMLMLAAVGQYVERHIGQVKYLLLYLATGLAGNVVSLYLDLRSDEAIVTAGASGAVFGTVGALLAIAVKSGGKIEGLRLRGILLMIALSLFAGLTSSGVNNAAHVGGLVAGFILGMVLPMRSPDPE